MMHEGMALQPAQRFNAHRAIFADAAQIVAQQIDDHDVFGPILGAGLQFTHQAAVIFGSAAARPGPLDGTRFDVAGLHAQESLRRCAGDHVIAEIEISGEGSRVAHAQFFVKGKGIGWRRRHEALGDVDLKAIAGADVFDGTLDGCQVIFPIEVADQAGESLDRKLRRWNRNVLSGRDGPAAHPVAV